MREIFDRRSVRNFTDQPVEQEKITELLKAAMQAPSAGNQQPWEFVVVDKREILDDLAAASVYAAPLKRAPLGIAVLGRQSNLVFPEDSPSDLSAATENILIEAVHLGLGAVWLGTAPAADRMEHVKKVLALPAGIEAYSLIAIGYPAQPVHATSKYDESRVHFNTY
jgi:nitroreductase